MTEEWRTVRTVEWVGEHRGMAWQAGGSLRLHAGRQSGGSAFGQLGCADYEVGWQLVARAGWELRTLDVRLVGTTGGRRVNRTLLLERVDAAWQVTAWHCDAADLPAPGLTTPMAAHQETDVVIDGCPLSHVVPLRRLGLAGPGRNGRLGRRALAGLPTLRVLLPSLAVVPTRQRYHWMADADADLHADADRSVRIRQAFAGEEAIDLAVDAHGMPVTFGGLSRLRDTALVA